MQVDQIVDDTHLSLSEAATETYGAAKAFAKVKPKYHRVSIYPSTNAGTLFGVTVPFTDRWIEYVSMNPEFVKPIEINGASNAFFVATIE